MEIDGISGKQRPQDVEAARERPKTANTPKTNAVDPDQDRISFSENKNEFLRIRRLVDLVPDVRPDRVQQLAHAVHLGAYEVDALDLADSIIDKKWIDLMA